MAKATAVRNIRDDHQKAFLKIFNSLCGRFNRWQVWQDFVMVTAIEISNATDKQNAPERTKTYQTIISKYSDAEQNKFAELLAEVIMGMEQNPDQDFLGELYMLCELGNDASGQFFTPYDVCRCMVEISGGSDPAAENAGFFSVSDPACGAGALLIAFANLCRHRTAQRFLWTKPPGGSALMCRFGIPASMSAKPRPSKKSKFKERTELDERYSGFYRA